MEEEPPNHQELKCCQFSWKILTIIHCLMQCLCIARMTNIRLVFSDLILNRFCYWGIYWVKLCVVSFNKKYFLLKVIGFDGSTTVSEFLSELNRQSGTRSLEQSGFTIHSDDPIDEDLDHALLMEDKVSTWVKARYNVFSLNLTLLIYTSITIFYDDY